jgi:hypothetical protein
MGEAVLVLCAAVVKAAVKLWAGGSALGDEMAGDLTDLVRSRVSGALEQRKVRRQFSQMEELVAGQILSAMNAEFRDLGEGERSAAIMAVTETISRARLTDRVLFAGNLDPLYLEGHVRRFIADATRDLSGGGIQLYDRVLAQCCADIIEIADKLPRFQAGAFTELLRRDSQILRRLEEVLQRLPAPIGDDSGPGRVEVAYRQRVAKAFDRLEIFGLDFAAQWYALSIAYVNLTVSVQSRGDGAEHWLAQCPRLLIEGMAGGGKTTILQWIAVRAARRDFTGPAAALNGRVPFFIRLREYAGRELPQPEQFLDKVAPLLAPEAGDWPRRQLFGGRAIVCVDGIDEVPQAQRRDVIQWLRDLTDFFPQSRYIVTTRPGALADGALAEAGFTPAILEPMPPALVATFTGQWHAAMSEWEPDAQAAERLARYRDDLLRTLDNDRFLRELANTPLLAGLICALNQHLAGQLPRRRGEIFERALAMFHERDRKRGIEDARLRLDLPATSHLLGDLALWMVRNAAIEVAAETAGAILARSAAALPSRPDDTDGLYRHLLLRSGLLREPTAGQADFVHRTFQEYLAAKALIASGNVGEIVRSAGDDQWSEIVVLAAGQGNNRQVTDLLRGLMRPRFRGQQRYRRRLLAVASLEEIRGADPQVLRDIFTHIPELVPPRSLKQAEALSHAGERLLPYLKPEPGRVYDVRTYEAMIRAASYIGGPEALDVIAAIACQVPGLAGGGHAAEAANLHGELWRGWDYFRGAGYPQRVLIPAGMRNIQVNSPRALAELAGLPGIDGLTLAGFVADDTDLSAVDDIHAGALEILGGRVRSLSRIIRAWPAVQRVELYELPELADITALRRLPNLEMLFIAGCGGGRQHLAVARALNLKRFRISTDEVNLAYP